MTETAPPPNRAGDDDPVRQAILADLLAALDGSGRARAPELLDSLRLRHPGHEQTITRLYAAAIEYERLCASLPGRAAPAAPRLLPGDTLGDFTVESLLAVGGMSEVYRARQRSLGDRLVALKVVPASATDGRGRGRLRREALALAGLHHESLVEVHGFGEQDGLLFYAMRLVEGPTLAQVLARAAAGGVSTPAWRRAVVTWMADVADALACVHAAELVHRDVKPANVVLEGPPLELPSGADALARLGGTAVLVDFGLAKAVDTPAGTLTQHHAATPAYAAPEQLLGQPLDGRADVFALGVSLHDLLAARLPGARAQASAGLPPLRDLLPDVDDDLAAVVARACDPQARWRYPDAAALRDDLRAWLAGRDVSARRAPLAVRVARAARARPGRFAAVTAGVLLLAAVLVAGGTVLTQAARSAGDAQRAAQRGDLLALQDSLREVPPLLDPLVLDASLASLAPRIRGDVSDRLSAACTLLRLRDRLGAVREAVTALRVNGPEHEPLLVRFLLAELAELPPGPSPDDLERLHSTLVLTARLFVERPVRDAAAARACVDLRARLMEVAADEHAPLDDRRHALSALTGCAALEDLPALLESGLVSPTGMERQRLGLLAVEHTVRRAHGVGELADVDAIGLWKRFLETDLGVRNYGNPTEPPPFGMRIAVMYLGRALAIAARAQGRVLDVSPLIGSQPSALSQAAWLADDGVIAALADPAAARAGALAVHEAPTNLEQVRNWGRVAAASGDSEVVTESERRCLELAGSERSAEWAASFAQGVEDTRAELMGLQPEVEPDKDTLLGVACAEGWEEIEREPGPPGDPAALTEGFTTVAAWCFSQPAPELRGSARALRGRCAPWQTDHPGAGGYLRLGAFGISELRFEFEVPDRPGTETWQFLLHHQLAARRYLPYQGRDLLQVSLDDYAGSATDTLTETGLSWDRFEIPADRLAPGKHVISLLLQDGSTTTYRVYAARLERPAR